MRKYPLLLLIACLTSCAMKSKTDYQTQIDPDTEAKANAIIQSIVIPETGLPPGDMIAHISESFLGTPYKADTLKGSTTTRERLVADFNGVDCFTLIDYVQALSLSKKTGDFLSELVKTRYVDGKVDYLHRKHFFSDWYATLPRNAENVTATVSSNYVMVRKNLNRKADGGEYIAGLGIIPRELKYIPGDSLNNSILKNLRNGDFIGVYTPLEGLDVTHVGIVIKVDNEVWFRNASSLEKNMKVVDTPLLEYMKTKPGIIVLRAVE
ncbi:DUF1460 domain-containing protein [Pantoea sp. BAV 3049]|uniref:DUF1460 domain-containing protein n=1 Tax=Pantoea sp. BAV 3049 TaxID=2654188 RepID=UPI00131BF3E8|nr:DUF1460 domain-containing protein [Pantoea sp. BAV 3049]